MAIEFYNSAAAAARLTCWSSPGPRRRFAGVPHVARAPAEDGFTAATGTDPSIDPVRTGGGGRTKTRRAGRADTSYAERYYIIIIYVIPNIIFTRRAAHAQRAGRRAFALLRRARRVLCARTRTHNPRNVCGGGGGDGSPLRPASARYASIIIIRGRTPLKYDDDDNNNNNDCFNVTRARVDTAVSRV